MAGSGNDYIFIENFDNSISCPESLALSFADRHFGIGGDGLVLIEKSEKADAKMRIFNKDGSEGKTAGNCLRCVGKYLHDFGYTDKEEVTIETAGGIKKMKLYTINNLVSSACVDMGQASLLPSQIPVLLDGDKIIDRPMIIGGTEYRITCVSVGNPHCVVFVNHVDSFDVEGVGKMFEINPIFPERVNTEFVRVVNESTIKMRVWERGNGETWACGTGACAAVVAAVENGLCKKGEDITVKVRGGDLIVNYTDERVLLTGNAVLIYEGVTEY
ncbi:Diaminopimelate epimerase [bioreactor metagenome]|uniref:Diaminopimelate epimerase n=1 Tax=bioreactor metagenome TaxID=1076179 RepID=A0A645E652_9ZZZZ